MGSNVAIGYVIQLVDYIERNIRSDLTLDDLADHVGLSRYHLNRLFRSVTGHPPMRYVRDRKLTHSLMDLLQTRRRIIDIAQEYHFDYEQSYIRSFSRRFHMTPDQYRRQKPEWAVTDRLDVSTLTQVGTDGLLTSPQIRLRPGFLLAGRTHYVDVAENDRTFFVTDLANRFYYAERDRLRHVREPEVYYGHIRAADPEGAVPCTPRRWR